MAACSWKLLIFSRMFCYKGETIGVNGHKIWREFTCGRHLTSVSVSGEEQGKRDNWD